MDGAAVSGTITVEDFQNAQRLHRRRAVKRLHRACALITGCGALALWLAFADVVPDALIPGALLLGGGAGVLIAEGLLSGLRLPRVWRRIHGQSRGFDNPFTYRWDETTLRAASALGNAARPWSHFLKYKEDDRVFLLYHSDHLFEVLPKRWFTQPRALDSFHTAVRRLPHG